MNRVGPDPFLDVVPRRSTWIHGGFAGKQIKKLVDGLSNSKQSHQPDGERGGQRAGGGYGDGEGNHEKAVDL